MDSGIELVVSFIAFITFFLVKLIRTTVMNTCACADEIPRAMENKKLEPVSGTSRRGTRAVFDQQSDQKSRIDKGSK